MKVFTWSDILNVLNTGISNPYFEKGTGISVGSFDGLHKGHRKLINLLIDNCKKQKLLSGVLTFTRPLPSIKHSDDYKGDISTLNQRLSLFESLGIDFVILVDFDDSFASLIGADFFNILLNVCNMQLITEGVDFRCGYKGSTDVQAIRYWAEQKQIHTIFMEPVFYHESEETEERISSSYIREMILKGFFATVEELLERPYEIEISDMCNFHTNQILPPQGVYHCKNENGDSVRVIIKNGFIEISEKSKKILF